MNQPTPVTIRSTRQKKTVKDDVIETLRKENKNLEQELSTVRQSLREAENARLRTSSMVSKAEGDREALYDAVRVLSNHVTNATAPGRRIRAMARKALEAQKIPPPSTLGSSRNRRKRKKFLTEKASSAE